MLRKIMCRKILSRNRAIGERARIHACRKCSPVSAPSGAAFYALSLFLLCLTFILALTFASPAQAQEPADATLPAGPMQTKATTACTECHEARIILQQRLSKGAWTKEVDKMTKWGAVVDPADRDALIDYLSTNFSPDKPVYDAPRTEAKGAK